MATLLETLAKKHSAPESGEHRKSEHKSGGKEHRKEKEDGKGKEKNKEKSKLKYPEMKLEDVAAKIAGGYTFKAAKDDDYKDKSKEKNIVSIKLPKMGVIPFLMTPPVDAKNSGDDKVHKPMDIKGDPAPKDKVESADKHPAQQWYKENFDKFKLHGIDVKKDGVIELDHGDSDTENSDKSFKDHMKKHGYDVKTTMGNPKKDNKIMYKIKQNKSKVESAFDSKSLVKKFSELGAHHLKALTTDKKEDHEEYHKHAKDLKEDIDNSEKETPDRKRFHENMKNAIRQMDSLHKKFDKHGNEAK